MSFLKKYHVVWSTSEVRMKICSTKINENGMSTYCNCIVMSFSEWNEINLICMSVIFVKLASPESCPLEYRNSTASSQVNVDKNHIC